MPALNAISPVKLMRLVGTPKCPVLIDVRMPDETEGRLFPGAILRHGAEVSAWGQDYAGLEVVVICRNGQAVSPGVAAWLRYHGADAQILEGGVIEWLAARLPLIHAKALPPRDEQGRTLWVTRARPKVDRIACPWLIRRFVDPQAVFLFAAPSEIPAVSLAFGATPFDLEGEALRWTHRGELCTFDAMVEDFGLGELEPLARLATIVRGADTDRVKIAPEAAGLLAVSLGLSRMFEDDHAQLDAGMLVYDALYRWSRDASDETHNWASHRARK
ncbi:chromate resistance protein ChrB domain-containing protein [Novosphingobium rosa]|jgi:rhodanese-related sulfurtransferase|uniref:chromate resistance protein ChrB domain-containing protein n=1 Tax=Novosphingobium rosa TaxID=76978 RepID=UPI00083721FF|nr:sulfurtransferase/chromate resistance protein [Novosphingobium rosa]